MYATKHQNRLTPHSPRGGTVVSRARNWNDCHGLPLLARLYKCAEAYRSTHDFRFGESDNATAAMFQQVIVAEEICRAVKHLK
jgi:hypothetical protein